MKKLLIYGCGFPGIIRYIHGINQRNPEWEVLGIIDDEKYGKQEEYLGTPIIGNESSLQKYVDQGCYFFNNVASTTAKMEKVTKKLDNVNAKLATLIVPEPPNFDLETVQVGEGSLISNQVLATAYAKIGRNVCVREGAMISHDNIIGDFCFIGPGAILLGFVEVGEKTYIGAGARIMSKVTIGKNCMIGMGSVIMRDVPDNTKMFGNPAKKLPL
jgi:sugar O-acyltransferase (sialic acid O-acetyltransferase NeuD family)